MNKLKYYNVVIEGIDKTGKDLLKRYIERLSNYKYMVTSRGIISQISHTRIFDRDYEYELSNEENNIYIYLFVEKDDWEIRCKLTNEPIINYHTFTNHFESTVKDIEHLYPNINIFYYNSSLMTPYVIAKEVITRLDKLNDEVNE